MRFFSAVIKERMLKFYKKVNMNMEQSVLQKWIICWRNKAILILIYVADLFMMRCLYKIIIPVKISMFLSINKCLGHTSWEIGKEE